MSETDSGRPRRAVDDSDGRTDQDSATGGPTDGVDEAGTGRPSRAWVPADDSGAGDATSVEPEVSTPIPPPAPTLPEPTQPPSAGRRFSAEDLPDDWQSAAPRRSAVSASSPPFSPSEVSSPVARSRVAAALSKTSESKTPSADAAAAGAAAADVGSAGGGLPPLDAGSEVGATPAPGGRRRTLAWVAGVVAAALVIGLIAWFAVQRPGGTATPTVGDSTTPSPSAPASQAPALADTQLIAASELAKLRKGTTWTLQDPAATTGLPRQPACVELSSTGGASPDAELNRLFTANKGGGTVLQIVQAWPDADAAGTALTALVNQAGACKTGLLRTAERITGLADDATALTVQTSDDATHALLFVRTGRFVSVLDGATGSGAEGLDPAALATASAVSQSRQCGPAAGACPSKPKTSETTPPATDPVGWLALVDLPRLTAGTGTWTATPPGAPKLSGSQCENVDLSDLPGTSDAAHSTYLLINDPKALAGFGIDEVIYTFAKASGASNMAEQLDKNFAGCGERGRTATVKDSTVTTADADGKKLTATSYLVVQRVSESKTATFRVGVAAVGNRLVYLLANSSDKADFGNARWNDIVGRATQRATQFA